MGRCLYLWPCTGPWENRAPTLGSIGSQRLREIPTGSKCLSFLIFGCRRRLATLFHMLVANVRSLNYSLVNGKVDHRSMGKSCTGLWENRAATLGTSEASTLPKILIVEKLIILKIIFFRYDNHLYVYMWCRRCRFTGTFTHLQCIDVREQDACSGTY